MNRHALPLLLAAAFGSLGLQEAGAQSVLRRCDKPMADAEAAVREVGACADSLAAAAALKAGKTPGGAPAPLLEAPAEIVAAATAEPFSGELLAYAAYLAYSTSGPGACSPQPFGRWDNACQNLVLDLRAARAAVGSAAEFASACGQTDQPKSPAEAKEWSQCCAKIAANIGRPSSCADALKQCTGSQADCRSFVSSLAGDAGDCALIVPGNPESCSSAADCQRQKASCQGTALFVKAFKAKDAALCGASDYCRVLMGEGKKVAQEHRARLLKSPAGRWYVSRDWDKAANPAPAAGQAPAKFATSIKGFSCEAPLGSPANRQAASALIAAARTCYSDVELALSQIEPAVMQALDAQEEKVIRLGLRLDAHFSGAGAAKAGAPAPKRAQ
ncbi:MAG: hypothetical protein NDJ72_07320 [Elusimicrobia bacterium]|nr:hypothetical protein [Elusimicrobiota bacterium]